MRSVRSLPGRGAKRTVTITVVMSALLLAGCMTADDSLSTAPAGDAAILAEHGLDGLDVRELVETLDAMPLSKRTETVTT